MKKYANIVFALLFSSVVFVGSHAFAAEKMLIAGHDYPPYYNKDGKGMMTEIYEAAGKAGGIDVEVKVYPIRRGITSLFRNRVDGFSPGQGFMSPDQVKKSSMIPTVFYAVIGFAYHDPDRNKNVVLNSPADFKGKHLGFIVDSPVLPAFKNQGITFENKKDGVTLLKMLKIGRFDFSETSLLNLLLISKQLFNEQMVEFNYVKFVNVPCSVAFHNGNPRAKSLKTKFSKGMEIIKKNGKYIQIAESYWGKGNIQKEGLPDSLKKYGVVKTDFNKFSEYNRTAWGKIVK